MKRSTLFTLALALGATAAVLTVAARRGPEACAAAAKNSGAATSSATISNAPASAASAQRNRRPTTPQTRAPRANNEAAANFAVQEIDTARLLELLRRDGGAGRNRPLLVNFWATWCVPCREEFPDLVRLDNEFRARGLEFFTVSLDELAEIRTTVPQFLREMRATASPAYLLNASEPADAITAVDPSWGGGLPATFLYDARGQIVFKHMGRIRPDELRAAIERTMSAR